MDLTEVTLNLTQLEIFAISCLVTGMFFSPDATAEQSLQSLESINILKSKMDEEHLEKYGQTTKLFRENRKEIEAKLPQLIDKINELFGDYGPE